MREINSGQKGKEISAARMSMKDVFSFGWHSHWHLKAFERDEVIDFYDGDGYRSLLHAYKGDLRKGYPIFPMKSSLN